MDNLIILAQDPAVWAALVTLIAMEVVLGIDNLIFISILTNKLPVEHRRKSRAIGISLALVMRLILLSFAAWIVKLTAPVFNAFGHDFSWKDMILIAGGLFLVWKATKEIHHSTDPAEQADQKTDAKVTIGFGAAIFQIILLDIVFSVDSIITAVGMTEHLPVMVIAVLVAVATMMLAVSELGSKSRISWCEVGLMRQVPEGRSAQVLPLPDRAANPEWPDRLHPGGVASGQ